MQHKDVVSHYSVGGDTHSRVTGPKHPLPRERGQQGRRASQPRTGKTGEVRFFPLCATCASVPLCLSGLAPASSTTSTGTRAIVVPCIFIIIIFFLGLISPIFILLFYRCGGGWDTRKYLPASATEGLPRATDGQKRDTWNLSLPPAGRTCTGYSARRLLLLDAFYYEVSDWCDGYVPLQPLDRGLEAQGSRLEAHHPKVRVD